MSGKKIVVDTSVIVAVIANQPEKASPIEITRVAELVAPHSVHWEIGNAFSAMLKRRRITYQDAMKAMEVYGKIPIRFLEVELSQTLRLAADLAIYAYDAYILRCAQKYRVPLVSLDQNLVAGAKNLGLPIQEVC